MRDTSGHIEEVYCNEKDTYWYLERYYGVPKPRWVICATDKLDDVITKMLQMQAWDIEGSATSIRMIEPPVEYRLRCCKTGEIIPGDAIV